MVQTFLDSAGQKKVICTKSSRIEKSELIQTTPSPMDKYLFKFKRKDAYLRVFFLNDSTIDF